MRRRAEFRLEQIVKLVDTKSHVHQSLFPESFKPALFPYGLTLCYPPDDSVSLTNIVSALPDAIKLCLPLPPLDS